MNRIAKHVTFVLLLAALSAPAFADDPYGREYALRTLDPRVAELLVWDICKEVGKKSERCEVQVAQGRQLVVLAQKEVHARIVRMLVERDIRSWESQAFQITLVRAASRSNLKPIGQPNIQRALEAVRELFPQTQFEIVDQGLIRTADKGSMQLGDREIGVYEVNVRQRSAVTKLDSRELTVELEVQFREPGSGPSPALSSVLTVAVGETIVAGSSRVGSGEDALLVVLTALDKE